MTNTETKIAQTTIQPDSSFRMKIDRTTFVVGMHFSKTSKETMDDKVKRLINEDVKASNF